MGSEFEPLGRPTYYPLIWIGIALALVAAFARCC